MSRQEVQPQPSQDSISESSVTKAVHESVPKVSQGGNVRHDDLPTEEYPYTEVSPKWVQIREYCQDFFSEFMGTMVLILFGDGVVAQVVLSKGVKGEYQSISWGWGIGVMMGVYVSGKSGGHINPAVTFTNCVFRGHPWRKFPVYMLAQILGAMVGAAIVYANYKSAFDVFEGGAGIRTVTGPNATAGVFCTYPAEFMTRTGMFFSEVIASAILMMCIYAMADDNNIGAGKLMPIGLFFLIFGIGACFGWETGYAINLARDFGPRLVSYMIGYGHEVWSFGGYYFWIPMVAPFFGCMLGATLYDLFIYTGSDSPINESFLGLRRLASPRKEVWSNTHRSARGSKA